MTSRKVIKNVDESGKKPERILFFDLIRILCVAIIVYDHSRFDLIEGINQVILPNGYGPFNIYSAGLQGYAVFGMIFVSGAVLEYNYRGLERITGYGQFIFRRFIRLYPAFWMSLILGIILFPMVLQQHFFGVLFEFTGFFVILGQGSGIVNIMGWFIAAIFSLYLLYPWLSHLVKKYTLSAIIGLCLLSWGLRSLVLTYNIVPLDSFWRWFPLFNAFEFCLGIYIVQIAWYPKKENVYPFIRVLADLSFYVFLFHVIIIRVFLLDVEQLKPLISLDTMIAMNNMSFGYALYYLQMMATVLIISWVAMKADIRIQKWIMQRVTVRKYFKPE
jgi:peptidoglycan/LPS O-acetylase OafA/YrhL